MSRIYGGIHDRFDNREVQRSGRLVADFIVGQPKRELLEAAAVALTLSWAAVSVSLSCTR